ncbi:ribosomal-processing cysteine protease Prp [Cellulosilyticum sp. ST5]|uniref:ribosomal-processing cysteine protease Prp n=1 Tax=Cellulosilyticum sp. ST5 TaxID=3055805 RepID=UPI0039776266
MITATIRNNGFRVEGHAHMAPAGQDIACAGVSALVGAALNMVDWMINEQDQTKGIMDVTVVDSDLGDRLDAVILMLYYGLLNIQAQYPDYLRVVSGAWN